MNGPAAQQIPIAPEVIERLKNATSGSLTTELFRRGLRQCFLVGLKPMNPKAATPRAAWPSISTASG